MKIKIHALKKWFEGHPKISQAKFAAQVQSSQGRISLISNNKAGMSLALAKRISKRTGIPIERLGGKEKVHGKR